MTTAPQQATTSEPSGRLAITLWDFSWYTQAGPGEPFADLSLFDGLVFAMRDSDTGETSQSGRFLRTSPAVFNNSAAVSKRRVGTISSSIGAPTPCSSLPRDSRAPAS